jgi:polar amino acid transport system substrate-binding protein
MAMKIFGICVFIFALMLNQSTWAGQDLHGVKIQIVYAEDWNPVSYGRKNPARGLLPDKMDSLLSKELGMIVTHTPVPWGRAQRMVEMGSADAFVTTVTPKRLEFARASKSKVFVLPFVAAVKRNSDAASKLHNPDDLSAFKDHLFCDVLGNGWADNFYKDKPVKVHIAPSIKECLKLLNAGRVDAIIHAAPVMDEYVKELSLSNEIKISQQSSQQSPQFSLLVSKKSPLGQDFLDIFDAYFNANHLGDVN